MSDLKHWPVMMALATESQGNLESVNAPIHYCGLGKVNASLKAAELILKHGARGIINLGTAGSSKFLTHQLVECSGFVQRDMDLSPLGFPLGVTPEDDHGDLIANSFFYTNLQRGICGTGDSFEVGPSRLPCDLVDMESYAVAKVCRKLGAEFISIKYITDGADATAHNDWRENLKVAGAELLKVYQGLVKL